MPLMKEEQLQGMLVDGRITALTLDTNIFDAKQLDLNAPAFRAIIGLKDIPFPLILSNTVVREVRSHLARTADTSARAAKKALGEALFAFDTNQPTRDDLLALVTGGQTAIEAAEARLDGFIQASQCEVLIDSDLVNVETLFSAYFEGRPPFSSGKKAEFPDALALNALERTAADRNTGILVVSEDGDWRAYCERSSRLYLMADLDRALSLIKDAPLNLRRAILNCLADQDFQNELEGAVSVLVERMDIDVSGYASSGEVEFSPWAPQFKSIDWPGEREINIIEWEEHDDGRYVAVVSLYSAIEVVASIEMNFSVWDGVDKESVSMGGRTEDFDHREDATITVKLEFTGVGTEGVEVSLLETELDVKDLSVELGEIDVFEPEDYDSGGDFEPPDDV